MNGKSIFGAFILAAAVFTVWPGVLGSYSSMRALQTAKADREVLLAERTQILESATTEYNAYTKATAGGAGKNFSALVPIGRSGAELLSALDAMTSAAGVTLKSVAISDAKQAEATAYQVMTINAELSGAYSGLRTFLVSLEQYVRVLNVQTLGVSRDAQTGGLTFKLVADAYFIAKK